MQPTINLIRAIGVEFVRRAIRPMIIIGSIVVVLLLGLGGYLITLNAWWGILEAILVVWGLVFVALTLVIKLLMRFADPPQTKAQRRAVNQYVTKLQRVAEHLQTPQLIVLFRVIRDTLWPAQGKETFVEAVSRDTRALTPDFLDLQKEFQTKRDA